jgi:hypothetical protein
MNLSRREFGKRATLTVLGARIAGAAALGGASLSISGCNNLYNDILNWVPVGEASLNSILTVLTANGIVISPAIQSVVALIEAGFTALTAAIKEYQSANPPPVGALAKIHAAFTAIVDNFSTFLKSLNVSGSLLGTIVGLAQVIFSTIAAFVNQVPAAPAAVRFTLPSKVAVAATAEFTVSANDKYMRRGSYKKGFNSKLTAGEKLGVVCPAAAYLPVTFWEKL